MKLCTKKIYCNSCQKMVRGREQKAIGNTSILCPGCGRPLWVWNGITWRYMNRGV